MAGWAGRVDLRVGRRDAEGRARAMPSTSKAGRCSSPASMTRSAPSRTPVARLAVPYPRGPSQTASFSAPGTGPGSGCAMDPSSTARRPSRSSGSRAGSSTVVSRCEDVRGEPALVAGHRRSVPDGRLQKVLHVYTALPDTVRLGLSLSARLLKVIVNEPSAWTSAVAVAICAAPATGPV